MRLKFTFLLGFLCLFLVTTPVWAIPMLSLDEGTLGSIPNGATNDILDDIYGSGVTTRDGYYGAQIRLTEEANVTFTYLYYEAGWSNDFYLNENVFLFNNKTSSSLAIEGPFLLSAGDIPFHFRINSDIYAPLSNGTNPNNSQGEPLKTFLLALMVTRMPPREPASSCFSTIPVPAPTTTMTIWRFVFQYRQFLSPPRVSCSAPV